MGIKLETKPRVYAWYQGFKTASRYVLQAYIRVNTISKQVEQFLLGEFQQKHKETKRVNAKSNSNSKSMDFTGEKNKDKG